MYAQRRAAVCLHRKRLQAVARACYFIIPICVDCGHVVCIESCAPFCTLQYVHKCKCTYTYTIHTTIHTTERERERERFSPLSYKFVTCQSARSLVQYSSFQKILSPVANNAQMSNSWAQYCEYQRATSINVCKASAMPSCTQKLSVIKI